MQIKPATPPEIPVFQLFRGRLPLMKCSEKQACLVTLGGRIRVPRCQALSKRNKRQCMGPTVKGKNVCRFHGGKSTGPVTEQGRKRCAAAKTVHGWETREKRSVRAAKLRELSELERLMKLRGCSFDRTSLFYLVWSMGWATSLSYLTIASMLSSLPCTEAF